MLSRDEITRYSRNILLPEVRKSGQEKLKSSSVLVVGAGGIGSPVLTYLAASGIGRIRCVDSDHLDLTNLQRQVLYRTSGVGSPKIDLAREQIHSLNPNLELDFRLERFTDKNANDLVTGMDLVIETSDNFPTKFLVSDVCVENRIDYIAGGILRFDGQVLCVRPGQSACYRCIFENMPEEGSVPNCAAAGVIGAVAGVIGSIMAGEAVKILLGRDESFGLLQQYNLLESRFRSLRITRRSECTCGRKSLPK